MLPALGFLPRVDQPAVSATADFSLPTRIDFGRLDGWLTGPLGLETRQLADCTTPPPGWPASDVARQFAGRGILLYAELAQACGLPCFATGRVVALERRGTGHGSWRLKAIVPWVDQVSPEIAGYILRFALGLLERACAVEPAGTNVAKAHTAIQRNLLDHLQGLLPTGKSTVPVCKVAWRLGIPLRHVGDGTFLLGQGSRVRLSDRSASAADSAIGARVSQDKHATASLLGRAGLPVPEHRLVTGPDEAEKAASVVGWPVVVKPADRDRGEGVSIGLRDGNAVRAAFETARSLGRRVLVERQVEGLCHRLLVVEGAMVFATRRNPKSVVGNGRNSVEELVARGNAARMLEAPWKRSKPFPLDELAVESLRRAGLTPQSVPAAGSFVPLRIIESTEWGGWTEDVTERVHPDNAAAALDAAALLGLRVAGVDMISADISMPWHENGAVINEVNFAPFFGGNLHSPKAQAFIRRLVGGDGRIPVWAVLAPDETGEALGKRLQQRQTAAGLRCWMTTSSRTDAPSREAFPLSQEGLHGRCLALLCRPDVDALVLVIGEDAQLEAGLPVDRLDRCYRVRPAGDSRDGGLPELLRARTVEGGFLEIDADDPKTLTD